MSIRQVRRISRVQEFYALERGWKRLQTTAHVDNLFFCYPWLSEWWRVYGAGYELWTLVAQCDDEIEAILPLVLERTRDGMRRLVFMGAGESMPTGLDVIAQNDVRADAMRAFWWYLWEHRAEWDLIDWEGVWGDAPILAVLAEQARARRLLSSAQVLYQSPFAVLPRTFDEYLGSRGATTRKHLRYDQRRLARDWDARYARVQTPAELESVFQALVRLHQARWNRLGQKGAFANARFTDFHKAAARVALGENTLRLYYIQIGAEIVAVLYCYRIGARVLYYSSGFDERWSKYNVGTLALAYAVEQSIAEGAIEFDFLQGEEEYKSHWATGSREEYAVQVAGPHLRAQWAWARSQSTNRIKRWTKEHVPRDTRLAIHQLLQKPNAR